MRAVRALTTVATAVVVGALAAPTPAGAAAATSFTFSSTGPSADAVFSNAPANGQLVAGRVYTDVFVFAADEVTTVDGVTHSGDYAYVDVFSYKADRRGNVSVVSSSSGYAEGAQADFSADAKRLSTATLTAQVAMESCTATGCTPAGTASVNVTWTGSGPVTTFKSGQRTNDPGQFHSAGRFSGSSRFASASGTVPVLGSAQAVFASISTGKWTERTICHGC